MKIKKNVQRGQENIGGVEMGKAWLGSGSIDMRAMTKVSKRWGH